MRIVIDLQGAQTGSRFRGIGRYSLSLALAMVRNAGSHEIHIALNARLGDSIELIRAAFGDSLPSERFHVWMPPSEGIASDEGIEGRVREAFFASLKPDIVHVSSLFEGWSDCAVTCINSGVQPLRTAVTLFDLIPMIYQKRYLDNPIMAKWYFRKIAHLRRADLLLGISASAAQEAIDHLGFENNKVVNISSAIDDDFQCLPAGSWDKQALLGKYSIFRPYVMYTGGIDHRKNVEGLIRAYALLPRDVRATHQLAIVCSITDDARAMLKSLARNSGLRDNELILTGFVPDEDLVKLYNAARLFVFPSWHEGFGLPALEAMQCGAPVIGACTSSLPEVIGLEDALFDPRDENAIMEKMHQGLIDEPFRQRLLEHAPGQAAKFSWDASAIRAITAMEEACTRPPPRTRPRLAYISPLPPERSGIADYSADLIPELARHYEIDVIVAQPHVDDPAVAGSARIRDLAWFELHGPSYDRVVYQFGNSEYHVHMVEMLERIPGVVVLHDFFLSGMYAYRELTLGMKGSWPYALYRSHGYAPLSALAARQHEFVLLNHPCNFTVLAAALGLMVHSAVSTRMARQYYPNSSALRWREVPLLRAPAQFISPRAAVRGDLDLPSDAFVVCSFGFTAPTKLNIELVDAWLASPLANNDRCYLVFVGGADPNEYGAELEKKIRSSSAADRIRITGFVTQNDFRGYLQAADVAVQLRTMSRGETSAAVLDALNHGLATIVNANGSMADLPDDVVIKLPDDFDNAALRDALALLYQDEALRAKLSAAARTLMTEYHQPRRCADAYARTIEEFYLPVQGSQRQLMSSLGRYMADGGNVINEEALGQTLAWNLSAPQPAKQVFIDVVALGERGAEVDRDALRDCLLAPPVGWRIEPVIASGEGMYSYARQFTLELLGCPKNMLCDEPVDARVGDILIFADGMPSSESAKRHLLWQGVTELAWSDWLAAAGVLNEAPHESSP
ncbi:glycosyltransferase [Xanthomonas floridensis]|uniref:Glycosyltransferase n=1 Tax=Xanthomonas floridensis TaxID=1843580 RepID=A0ABU5PTL2_9XANT|nr:glycosyltransferase [Xanthomonas floridensis]MEA5122807.1 glycosyltransferase [Xanthomonas floridensis]MEA5131152.1 glycosyltransferase [Xanthomonas floridensis]